MKKICKECNREFDLEEGFLFMDGGFICPECTKKKLGIK